MYTIKLGMVQELRAPLYNSQILNACISLHLPEKTPNVGKYTYECLGRYIGKYTDRQPTRWTKLQMKQNKPKIQSLTYNLGMKI